MEFYKWKFFQKKNKKINIDLNPIYTIYEFFEKKEKMINLNPIYIYKMENSENIEKMINLKENRFLVVSNENISIFKYNINENNDISNNFEMQLIDKCFVDNNLVDAFIFEKDNKEIIALNTEFLLYFLDISNLKIIYKIKVNSMTKNSLVQINNNRLLFKENDYFKIIDLNTFKIKLIVENIYNENSYLFNMEDGTIIQAYDEGIKHYSIKTLEELPNLIHKNHHYGCEEPEFIIVYIYKLNNNSIVLCHKNGDIEKCHLKFI